jgi:hypothetical protein
MIIDNYAYAYVIYQCAPSPIHYAHFFVSGDQNCTSRDRGHPNPHHLAQITDGGRRGGMVIGPKENQF